MVLGGEDYATRDRERDIDYVTNGVFIAAAIAEGFCVRRISGNNPNARFNISSAAWKGRVRM
jgi:hypothetical protein